MCGLKRTVKEREERIIEIELRIVKITKSHKQKESTLKRPLNLWDYKKTSKSHVIGVLKEQQEGKKVLKELMTKIFTNWANDTNLQMQEAKNTKQDNWKKFILSHSQISEN